MAAEVGVEAVALLVVVLVPTGRVLNGKEHPLRSKNSTRARSESRTLRQNENSQLAKKESAK